jgi:hypothetical protein
MPSPWRAIRLIALAVSVAAAGCDKVSQLTEQAQQVVSNTVEDIKPESSSVELQIERPVTAKGCYASLLRVGGRPAVLQVASYRDPSHESFPSFFLRAQTEQTEPGALVGAVIPAEVYVQPEADGPIWHTAADQPAQIVVRGAAADGFAADLQGVFVNSATGASQSVTGKLNGSLK